MVAGGAGTGTTVATPVAQSNPVGETIYYADSLEASDGASALYQVFLDSTTLQATVTEIVRLDASLGHGSWENIDVLAASPDGARLFFVDDGRFASPNGRLGVYNLDSGELDVIGVLDYSDTGPVLPGVSTTDLASVSANGAMYLARVDTDSLYRVDMYTGDANRVGFLRNSANGAVIDLAGGDLAFDNTGRLFLLTNGGTTQAPRGLYRATSLEIPVTGDVALDFIGDGGSLRYTGLAVRDAGRGALVASASSNAFPEIDRNSGLISTIFGTTAPMNNGDMTTGQLAICTSTVAYHQTNDWNGRTIKINGEVIDQQTGQQILQSATERNFSFLFAQLIAAKLNCESCGGAILEAESFLLSAGVFVSQYDARFASRQQAEAAARLAAQLEAFNGSNICNADADVGRGRFTGGGQIRVGNVRVSRGLTIHCDLELSNNLQVNWGRGNKFHMTRHLTTVACTDDPLIDEFPPDAPIDTLVGIGTGRFNGRPGYTIEFTLKDAGEPGRHDQMAIRIYETANTANVVLDRPLQFLRGGNLQAHDDQPHR
jgi:hypothetical protein